MKPSLSTLRWLYPGMRLKRWLTLMAIGTVVESVGLYLVFGLYFARYRGDLEEWLGRQTGAGPAVVTPWLGIALVSLGLVLVLLAVRSIVRGVSEVLSPHRKEGLGEIVFRQRQLEQGQRIAVIGGGTGLSTMLRGLKVYSSNLAAIVTVTDDGGSSGRLMREHKVLPPGDIRNCLVALADNEGLMSDLFQYRFDDADADLGGHSFGNLLLLAMTNLTGSFDEAVRESSRVLAIRGRVLPATLARVGLTATMSDGRVVNGETNIVEAGKASPIKTLALDPCYVPALPEAVEAIAGAEAVIVGPGSVYTSIIPNLLVSELCESLRQAKGVRAYVCNVMTQPGETTGFTASDHVRVIEEHAGKGLFDFVLVNTAMPSDEARRRYAEQGAEVVEPDIERIKEMGYRPVAADFLDETNLVRHHPGKLAAAIMELVG